jgi:hypothetical protein
MMHQQYSRQFELKALHDLFTPVFLPGESGLIHLHPNCDNWETSCAIDMVNHFPYYRVDIKQWEDIAHKDICQQCLKSAWVQIFSFWNGDEEKALDVIKTLVILDNQLKLVGNTAIYARLISLSYPREMLAHWIPLMLEGEQIDKVFGKRWDVLPHSTVHGRGASLQFRSLPSSRLTYTEAFEVMRWRKYGDNDAS